jgi:transglutaminase-like putative cysteine protease
MLFSITHSTRFTYSAPVYLEPLRVMLRPHSNATQTVRSHEMTVTPSPDGISQCNGLDGNIIGTLWFGSLQDHLLIEVKTVVETHYGNPFNFLVTDPAALKLPLSYEPHLACLLEHYRKRDGNDPDVGRFAEEILSAANHATIPFLALLTEQFPKRFEYLLREHGDPWLPEETMRQGRGSCRDFAMLFIDVCRSAGIAARFVSGYCYGDEAADSYMHAWVEAYLPGAGWRGFDPSRGVATSDDYITVATGQRPQDAAPTLGSFRGSAIASLEAEISISLLENELSRHFFFRAEPSADH